MDIEEAIVRIHRIGEHATEFKSLDRVLQVERIGVERAQRCVVVLGAREFKQFARVVQIAVEFSERGNRRFQRFTFASEFLRAFAVAPNRRVFGELNDFS